MNILSRSFYTLDTVEVAKNLLGKLLVRRMVYDAPKVNENLIKATSRIGILVAQRKILALCSLSKTFFVILYKQTYCC